MSSEIAAIRERLREQAEQIRSDIARKVPGSARSREWSGLMPEQRMALLLLAGIDGDLQRLEKKRFAEFVDSEKIALQVAIRALYAGLNGAPCLRARAA